MQLLRRCPEPVFPQSFLYVSVFKTNRIYSSWTLAVAVLEIKDAFSNPGS